MRRVQINYGRYRIGVTEFGTVVDAGTGSSQADFIQEKEKNMKVLMINGSPRTKGNTYTALAEMEKIFAMEGIETEMIQVGNKTIRGCVA